MSILLNLPASLRIVTEFGRDVVVVVSDYIRYYAMHPHFVKAAGTGIDTAAGIRVMLADLIALTRMIFNPMYFGIGFLIFFIYAWFRMEAIAESKRTDTNYKILAKKSTVDLHTSLKDYSDQYNGKIFLSNGFVDVINSMKSKGKVPFKAASICQPVVPSMGNHILWKSNCMQTFDQPVLTDTRRAEFFEAVRPKAVVNIKDALHVVSLGGLATWRDPRKKIFSKERIVSVKFNFFDAQSFMSIYEDRYGFKRICSETVEEFFGFDHADVETNEFFFDMKNQHGIQKLKIPDDTFFTALALVLCYSEPIQQ